MILIIDDDPAQRRMTGIMLTAQGREWADVSGGQAGLDYLRGEAGAAITLVLLDMSMPDMSGLDVLRALRPLRPDLPVLVLTANGSVSNAVAAMQAGADDFLIKPIAAERLEVSLRNALKMRDLSREVRRLSQPAPRTGFDGLVAEAPATQQAIRLAARGAQSAIPILIEGESGVGKEVFARAVHAASDRAEMPFVAVNCGALPENLVESILFGHEKGAFTGAVARRIGKFEEAHGGVLFLDEVGELPLEAQVKLLRAIQEGEVDPVGGAKTVRTDFRLISATNRNLAEDAAEGRFREDLFYRLSVFPLTLPPLRARRQDIMPLAIRFAERFAAQEGKRFAGFTQSAAERLTEAAWPGNVRQLENMLYRAVVMAERDVLDLADFGYLAGMSGLAGATRDAPVVADRFMDDDGHVRPLADIEADALAFALSRYDGQITEAARRLCIGRSTLYRENTTR